MASRLAALTIDARDPLALGTFWAELLGRDVVDDDAGRLLPGSPTQVALRFSPSASKKAGLERVHLHVTSVSEDDRQLRIARALERGARHVDVGQQPDEGHIVLADPEGNEFCVIEPDNAYLAGCGVLGELACDGTRAVGLFWAAVLDWPVVWDRDEETAIQSPAGGTKIAWGGPPVAPKERRNRQRLELIAEGDPGAELERLIRLGATRLAGRPVSGAELADPDGNEFVLWRHGEGSLPGAADV